MRTITGNSSLYTQRLNADANNMIELVELNTNNKTYRWTSCNATIVSSGFGYDPFPGATPNGGPEESTDLAVGNMDFTVARTGDLGQLINGFQLELATVSVRRVYADTPDLGSMVIFKAKLADYTYDRNTLTGQARNIFGDLQASFPPYLYLDNCIWRFGSTGCGFNTSSITVAGSLNVAGSSNITILATSGFLSNSFAAGALERGRVAILSGANSGQLRAIRANSGDAIDLSHTLPFSLEAGGVLFSVFPGCRKRMIADCTSKYNNVKNFLGWPWIPTQELAF